MRSNVGALLRGSMGGMGGSLGGMRRTLGGHVFLLGGGGGGVTTLGVTGRGFPGLSRMWDFGVSVARHGSAL